MREEIRMNPRQTNVFGTGSSQVVTHCQICNGQNLESILFLGYLPPVNQMSVIGSRPEEQPAYPAELLICADCSLVQIGCVVDAKVLFPSEYPYTSSTTKNLRDNFNELHEECLRIVGLDSHDLVIDIGSNDGNLLSHFMDHKVLGVTPEAIGKKAIERGIPTIIDYFGPSVVESILEKQGQAKIVTATNVFAHIENIHAVLDGIVKLLGPINKS